MISSDHSLRPKGCMFSSHACCIPSPAHPNILWKRVYKLCSSQILMSSPPSQVRTFSSGPPFPPAQRTLAPQNERSILLARPLCYTTDSWTLLFVWWDTSPLRNTKCFPDQPNTVLHFNTTCTTRSNIKNSWTLPICLFMCSIKLSHKGARKGWGCRGAAPTKPSRIWNLINAGFVDIMISNNFTWFSLQLKSTDD
jgi:hypothetical protein